MSDTAPQIRDMMYPSTLSAEELIRLNLPGKRTELIAGRLVVREPAGFRHGKVAQALSLAIGSFVRTHRLGYVLAAETGFKLASDPDTVRAADVAFVRSDRVPQPMPSGYASLAPDLVVEVLSPDDRSSEVRSKAGDWLRAGTRLVWVVDPARGIARVYSAEGSERTVDESGSLDGEDVLPGFVCALSDVLGDSAG